MRMISILLGAMVLGVGLAGGASARVLGYEGTLTLDFIQPGLWRSQTRPVSSWLPVTSQRLSGLIATVTILSSCPRKTSEDKAGFAAVRSQSRAVWSLLTVANQ